MKALHIVPAAMNYFDDIKMAAFNIVQKLHDNGIDGEVITLQYDQPTQQDQENVSGTKDKKGTATSFHFKSSVSLQEALSLMNNYDLVHFHIPFMGAGKNILKKLNEVDAPPLLVSYYRPVKIIDILSVIISLYSQYYVTKLIKRADIVTLFPQTYNKDILTKIPEDKLADISINEKERKEMKLDEDRVFKIKLNKQTYISISIDKLIYVYRTLTKNNK